MQDFSDLKAKFMNILERDSQTRLQMQQRPSSVQADSSQVAKPEDKDENMLAKVPHERHQSVDRLRLEQLKELTPSETLPMLMSGERLDMKAIVDNHKDATPRIYESNEPAVAPAPAASKNATKDSSEKDAKLAEGIKSTTIKNTTGDLQQHRRAESGATTDLQQ